MTTLAQYLEDSSAQPGVAQTVLALGEAALVISGLLRYRGMASVSPTGINVQGETQKPMDVFSNNEIIERLAAVPHVAFAVSEEVEDVIALNGQGTLAFFSIRSTARPTSTRACRLEPLHPSFRR